MYVKTMSKKWRKDDRSGLDDDQKRIMGLFRFDVDVLLMIQQ
jgi:hypothetical protein